VNEKGDGSEWQRGAGVEHAGQVQIDGPSTRKRKKKGVNGSNSKLVWTKKEQQ